MVALVWFYFRINQHFKKHSKNIFQRNTAGSPFLAVTNYKCYTLNYKDLKLNLLD